MPAVLKAEWSAGQCIKYNSIPARPSAWTIYNLVYNCAAIVRDDVTLFEPLIMRQSSLRTCQLAKRTGTWILE